MRGNCLVADLKYAPVDLLAALYIIPRAIMCNTTKSPVWTDRANRVASRIYKNLIYLLPQGNRRRNPPMEALHKGKGLPQRMNRFLYIDLNMRDAPILHGHPLRITKLHLMVNSPISSRVGGQI
jgi:hypothetical protein